MPVGSFEFDVAGSGLSDFAAQILVCRYDGEAGEGENPYTPLPNVFCEQIQRKEGAEPPTAQFRYILDGGQGYPDQWDQLFPLNAWASDYRVQAGDRLTCLWEDPQGAYRVIWDGFAQLPQVDLTPRSQEVTFIGVDASVRLWDQVITGRWQRHGSDPVVAGDPVETDLATHFNPDDEPNSSPDDYDEEDEESGAKWPVFLEPKLADAPDGTKRQTYWTLSKMVRYLLWYYNDEKYVDNPDFSVLDKLLDARAPKEGSGFYDPSNPSTYTEKPIVVRDFDGTGRPVLEVIEQQLAYAGFRIRPVCEGNPISSEGDIIIEEPHHYLEIYRFDAGDTQEPKELALDPVGTEIEPGSNNLAGFSATFDFQAMANRWTIETRPVAYEVGVLLAPGFIPSAGDESTTNRKKWLLSNQDSATEGVRQMYRLWIADECGEGHWSLGDGAMKNSTFDWGKLFIDPDDNPKGAYVQRYRPGRNTVFTLDPSGKPYRAILMVSRDYAGADPPCVWDGTGTWQVIGGGYRLLKDRLGIMIDIDNPMEWDIGKPTSGTSAPQEPSGVLDAVTSISAPGTAQRQKKFYLMLVTGIEADHMIDALADTRPASPYPFTVARQVDAADQYKKSIIDGSSPLLADTEEFAGDTQDIPEDDTDDATAYAEAMRAAHEFPPLSAVATIPFFTTDYDVGDRIGQIAGRDVSLQTNAGTEQDEGPYYPFVVGVTWTFGGKQETVLQLSDRRTEPYHHGQRRG